MVGDWWRRLSNALQTFSFLLQCRLKTLIRGGTTIQLPWPQKGFMVELSLLGIFSEAPSQPLWELWDCWKSALNINEDLEGSLLLWFCLLLLGWYNYEPGRGRGVCVATTCSTYTLRSSVVIIILQRVKDRNWLRETENFRSDRNMIKGRFSFSFLLLNCIWNMTDLKQLHFNQLS